MLKKFKRIAEYFGEISIPVPNHKKSYRLKPGMVKSYCKKYRQTHGLNREFYITGFDDASVNLTTYLWGSVVVSRKDFHSFFECY